MKGRVTVVLPDQTVEEWWLTNQTEAVSDGLMLLQDGSGRLYSPGDLPAGTTIRPQTDNILITLSARRAGFKVKT